MREGAVCDHSTRNITGDWPALLCLSPAEGYTLPTLYTGQTQLSSDHRHNEQGQAQTLTCSEKMPSRVFTSWAAVEDLGLWSPYPCRDNKKQ